MRAEGRARSFRLQNSANLTNTGLGEDCGEDHRERLDEEWRSHINDTPGDIVKLIAAFGLLRASHTIAQTPEAAERAGQPWANKDQLMFIRSFVMALIAICGAAVILRLDAWMGYYAIFICLSLAGVAVMYLSLWREWRRRRSAPRGH